MKPRSLRYAGLWRHYHAPAGLAELLEAFLDASKAEVATGVRFDTLQVAMTPEPDVVVVTTPAYEARALRSEHEASREQASGRMP